MRPHSSVEGAPIHGIPPITNAPQSSTQQTTSQRVIFFAVELRRQKERASYGFDAPYLLLIPAALILWNLVNALLQRSAGSLVGAAAIAACTGLGLYASRRGKFVVWEKLLDDLQLRGDEHVLDLGCGRGAVLLLAARRLTTGRAVGVDLWRKADQSGNSIDATRRNAQAEGLVERVELHTADMTNLPFADETFDLVLSSIAIHNVKTRAARRKAIEEAVRVLRPGGRLLIADLWGTRQYAKQAMQLGMINITRRGLGWRMWWTGPWVATRLVSAAMPVSDMPSSCSDFVRS